MVKVEARKGESPEKLLQRFKRAVNKDGILKELKQRSRYEKPSAKRRRQQKERMKTLRKAQKEGEGHVIKRKEKDDRRSGE